MKKIIWQYWHQGIENAPQIIKNCIASVKKFHPEYEQKILSFETIKDFVNIPQKYYELLEQKKIPIAIFSDILRLHLLEKYGGIWIDSTIFLTDKIPQDILNSDFFCPKKNHITDNFSDRMSCFFIKSSPENIFLKLTKASIENYWQKNNYLIHYFMFEHIVTMIAEANDNLLNEWNKIPFYSADTMGLLQSKFSEQFSKTEYEDICKKTPIHKLTYNPPKKKTDLQNTFFEYLSSVALEK